MLPDRVSNVVGRLSFRKGRRSTYHVNFGLLGAELLLTGADRVGFKPPTFVCLHRPQ